MLDKNGFTPLLAYVKWFVEEYDTLKQHVNRELSYQEYRHKHQTELYEISNIDLFSKRTENDRVYQQWKATSASLGVISASERQELELRFLKSLISEPMLDFVNFLKECGADVHATVQKLQFYR